MNNLLLTIIGNKIRRARECKEISQEDFAKQANIARSYYGRIERGEQNMSILQLFKIAKALDIDDWILLMPGLVDTKNHG